MPEPAAINTPPRPGRPQKLNNAEAGSKTVSDCLLFLFDVLAMKRAASLADIVRATGVSNSRAHRYLRSLEAAKLLTRDPQNGRYDIGTAAFSIGAIAASRVDPDRAASKMLRSLSDSTGMASHLSVWSSAGPVVLKSLHAPGHSAIKAQEGTHLSLISTASGRIFLAYMNSEEVKAVLAKDIIEWNSASPLRERLDSVGIEQLTADVLRNQVAYVAGLRNSALAALAAPVFDAEGRLTSCLTLLCTHSDFPSSAVGLWKDELLSAAQFLAAPHRAFDASSTAPGK